MSSKALSNKHFGWVIHAILAGRMYRARFEGKLVFGCFCETHGHCIYSKETAVMGG